MHKITLVGYGLWGRNILRTLLQLGAHVDVIDVDRYRREEALAQGAAGAFDSFDNRSEPDGFVVATPATTHANVITELLSFGKPIFVEKPFTTDLSSAQRLADAAEGRLFVMDIWRYHRGIEILATIVSSQELGPVELLRSTRTNWTSPRRDTDAIWTLLPHDLAIVLEILGQIPHCELARAEYREKKVVGALVSLGKAPSVVIEVSTRYGDKRREVRLHCRDGVAILNAISGSPIQILHDTEDSQPGISVRPFASEEPLKIELQTFLRYLDGGPPPKSSAEDGVMIVRAISEIRQVAGIAS